MNSLKNRYEKIKDNLNDRPLLMATLKNIFTFIGSLVSAFLFAYGFRAFVAPSIINPETGQLVTPLISGGISGLSQVILKLLEVFGIHFTPDQHNLLLSVLYFVINVPLFLLAFFKIGRKFAIFSLINVILVSLLISFIPLEWTTLFNLTDDFLARALFAGLLNGLSTSLAVRLGHSGGGIDIISIYVSSKTHSSMGKYNLLVNVLIILSFTFLSDFRSYAVTALYTIVYLFTSAKVIDGFCLRNKKLQLQIITTREDMAALLIQNLPHGCTVVDAKGAYHGNPKKIIYMDISFGEVKETMKIIRKIDKDAFVSVLLVQNVYGKFFIQPLK